MTQQIESRLASRCLSTETFPTRWMHASYLQPAKKKDQKQNQSEGPVPTRYLSIAIYKRSMSLIPKVARRKKEEDKESIKTDFLVPRADSKDKIR